MSYSSIDIGKFKAKLLTSRDEINLNEHAESKKTHPIELDQTRVGRLSRIDALQVQSMSIEAIRRKKATRQRIESALTRIENGTFGLCLECGEEINPKRLDFDPTFLLCIVCAGAREK